jgi:hypothetical protein
MGMVSQAAGRFVTYARLDLEQQLGDAVWRGSADGDRVAARAATAAELDPEAEHSSTARQLLAELAALQSPHLVPFLGVADRDDHAWLVSAHVEGVALDRLLGAATLTLVQAGYVAVQVLRGIEALREWGTGHGRLSAANVQVGLDGEPRLTDWAVASLARARDLDEVVADDLAAARGLIAELARNADRPVARHHAAYDPLMQALEEVGRGDSGADAVADARELEQALMAVMGDATGMAATRAEIGAVVTTLVRRRAVDPRPTPARHPTIVPVPQLLPVGRLTEADWHRRPHAPWVRRGLVLLVVAALLAGAYAAAPPVGDLVDRVVGRDQPRGAAEEEPTDGGPSESPTSAGPAQQMPRPVPVLAPAQAGGVTGVVLEPVAGCTAGPDCLIRATARITPAAEVRQVSLEIRVVNLCTGAVRATPAGAVTAQPGWTSVFVTVPVRLPRARPLAVVALTTEPARAASRPLLLRSSRGAC